MNNVIVALSNEEMIKINFVDIEKLYNFVVEKFFIWIHLGSKKLFWKNDLPRAKKKTHGKMPLCRVPKKDTRQNVSLPSAKKRHSAKTYFAECQKMSLGKIHLCRVPKKTLGKVIFVECFFCLVYFIWHSAKTVFAKCPIKYTRQSLRHSAKLEIPIVQPHERGRSGVKLPLLYF